MCEKKKCVGSHELIVSGSKELLGRKDVSDKLCAKI